MDFDATPSEEVLQTIDTLRAGDLVVLIQTDAFNLREYRFRLELFKRGLKVQPFFTSTCVGGHAVEGLTLDHVRERQNIEHVHLGLIPEEQIDAYVDALAFNPEVRARTCYLSSILPL
jgi:hypothetical protein